MPHPPQSHRVTSMKRKYFDMLEDCFGGWELMSDEISELMASNIKMKTCFKKDVIKLLKSANKETRTKYDKWETIYTKYFLLEDMDPQNEVTLCNFFQNCIEQEIIGLRSVWSVFFYINRYNNRQYNLKLNTFHNLSTMFKNLTKIYSKKGGDIG